MTTDLPAQAASRYAPPKLPPEPTPLVLAALFRLYRVAEPDDHTSAIVAYQLQQIADHLPCETISGEDGSVYMRRYMVARMEDGNRVYLHELLREDEDACHHSHPRRHGRALILAYGYTEERLLATDFGALGCSVGTTDFKPGMTNIIDADDFHRIAKLNGPCSWSIMMVSEKATRAPGEDSWSFKDPATGKVTGYKTFLREKAERIAARDGR